MALVSVVAPVSPHFVWAPSESPKPFNVVSFRSSTPHLVAVQFIWAHAGVCVAVHERAKSLVAMY